ncbi:potassium channel subfamily K member 13 [Triplophysa dalaica]|uniref:potassium channel subfamily K member 13 n=1 Tax=Triplophysa dalaica TaxID=1582913 RepID=UPI0024DFDD8B|nr:potassium channel subfamily K member 13 [Triplophysa dalaica]
MARILLLWLVIVLYTLFGAAVFSALERPSELEAHCKWNRQLAEFIQDHQIPAEELHQLLGNYEVAVATGIRMEPRRPRWDFSGAFYFVATVVSTIGFGMAAPATLNGKIFLIFYGLIGCSTTILFFNLFLEHMITLITVLTRWCRKQRRLKTHLNTEPRDGQESWKPSVYYVTLILAALSFLVSCGASGLYSAMEDWPYLESMYFCFVAFSTMGFGDMVSVQRACYEARWVYQIANSLIIILGVSCTYSLFNIASIITRQMLNWILAKLFRLRCCPAESEQGGADQFCCCSVAGLKVSKTANRQIRNHGQPHGTCHGVKNSLSSVCRCTSAGVDTVCESKTWGKVDGTSAFGCGSLSEGSEDGALSLVSTTSDHNSVLDNVCTSVVPNNHLHETNIKMEEHYNLNETM